MCCFTGPVHHVSDTNIFARLDGQGRQGLAYQMRFASSQEVAMVLPLPVKPGAGEAAVRFINLQDYEEFFSDLPKGFPETEVAAEAFGIALEAVAAPLEVYSVGSFEASYVPSVDDFARLDERFRLPEAAWSSFPEYKDYGFAVFKLKEGTAKVHPMAFSFPTALDGLLFFPTVHIHDGVIHAKEAFDHTLYTQGAPPRKMTRLTRIGQSPDKWEESAKIPIQFMKAGKTQGLVKPDEHLHRLTVKGKFLNQDILVQQAAV